MLHPEPAPVRPRVLAPASGGALPLEDELRSFVESGQCGVIQLIGAPGAGKTTALADAAAAYPQLLFLDEPDPKELAQVPGDRLVVYSTRSARPGRHLAAYRLAPWGEDEAIEYLLATRHSRCAAVMARLPKPDRALLGGRPDLWRVVLDGLAADPALPDARSALHRHLAAQLPDTDLVQRARSACLNALTATDADGPGAIERLGEAGCLRELVRVLRHPRMQLLLAAERIAADLRGAADCDYLALRLPPKLIRAAAGEVTGDEQALGRLRSLVAGPAWGQAMAASLLHAAAPGWRPEPDQVLVLAGAYLDRAPWAGARLPSANLQGASLRQADLTDANLDGADASGAVLRQARLSGGSLLQFRAARADLSGADLAKVRGEKACFDGARLRRTNLEDASLGRAFFRNAELTHAIFAGAYLLGATFDQANLRGTDFSGANLQAAAIAQLRLRDAVFRGACFVKANLSGSDLEEMDLVGLDFRSATLEDALLTAAQMACADLTNANLQGAKLGDINLEGASLRGADLRGATFHMGSSRSGLLFTPLASEGTRTGFYTDDSDEQYFKAPEEIRKANLCGVDLRGARIDDVDFYLVDLRGAQYDEQQALHFRRCRAILETPG
ncbi:MAG TPA: pentapeptide repeat-containing protein [Gemmataceae bacterium]|nr:pentapeptide repeat-containing protein [Gemmataceae bacterium]